MMTVTETSFHRFESKFAALVRRAAKLGLPAPAFDAVKTFVRRESAVTLANPEGLVPARQITFHGLAPRVNGYELVCTLDHVTLPGQTLVRFVPGVETDVSAFCAQGACCELFAMTGARAACAPDGVTLYLRPGAYAPDGRRVSVVKIKLNPRDLYDVEIGAVRGVKYTAMKTLEDIQADALRGIFERETSLRTSLERAFS